MVYIRIYSHKASLKERKATETPARIQLQYIAPQYVLIISTCQEKAFKSMKAYYRVFFLYFSIFL